MAILFSGQGIEKFGGELKEIFNNFLKKYPFYIYPDCENYTSIKYLITWNPQRGLIEKLSNLDYIFVLGAGIDSIGDLEKLPKNIKVVRLRDAGMSEPIANYVLSYVIFFQNNIYKTRENQKKKKWVGITPLNKKKIVVGVMGLGIIGKKIVKKLLINGYKVIGWRRKKNKIKKIKIYSGMSQLGAFLESSKIVVNILPLTKSNKNILNKDSFKFLRKNSFLINVGRGDHVVDIDLLDAIKNKTIEAAALDVFRKEPLPKNHPFWSSKSIFVTPHSAAPTDVKLAARQIISNIKRIDKNNYPIGIVDRETGY